MAHPYDTTLNNPVLTIRAAQQFVTAQGYAWTVHNIGTEDRPNGDVYIDAYCTDNADGSFRHLTIIAGINGKWYDADWA